MANFEGGGECDNARLPQACPQFPLFTPSHRPGRFRTKELSDPPSLSYMISRISHISHFDQNLLLETVAEDAMSYRGLVGLPNLDYSTLAVSRRHPHSKLNRRSHSQQSATISNGTETSTSTDYELPPFIRILNLLMFHTPLENTSPTNFITNVGILHHVAFSSTCPILGTGHHFAVYASPFDSSDHDFKPIDGRAFNNEVYCMKAPNFISGSTATPGPAKDAFRKEYYDTVLQELRVLLHPHLRSHDNIINLFGLDFQEDYDDCTTAWPVLVMENAEYGTLDTLQQDIYLDSDLARILLLDVARGIEALHQCNIIHGDVKSENVLICRHNARPYVARLSDFGLSVINPNKGREDHRLPGGTFLWRAPEFERALSIHGLQQTDTYSFGLTAWRVLVNNPNPYSLISLAALGLQNNPALSEVVNRAKAHPRFTQLVLQTMETSGVSQIYALRIIEATLGKDPASRDLSSAISVFAMGQANIRHE
jgi:Protein kinase domain